MRDLKPLLIAMFQIKQANAFYNKRPPQE